MNNNNSEKIYRPLTFIEKFRCRVKETGPDVGFHLIKIKTTIDISTFRDIFYHAQDKIHKINPAIKCKIIADPNDDKEFYFAFPGPGTEKEDVKFLYYKSSKNDEEMGVEYFFEKELNRLYDDDEALGRFKVVQIDFQDGVYTYYVFTSLHHAMIDGLSGFNLFLSVFKDKDGSDLKTNYSKPDDGIILHEIADDSLSLEPDVLFPIKHLPFLAKFSQRSITLEAVDTDGAFYTVGDDMKYVSVKEIVNERESYMIKMKMFKLSEQVYTAISNESKKRKIKMTSILDFVTAVAFKQVVNSYTTEPNVDVQIVSTTPVNLRSKLDIEKTKMGLWMSLYRNEHGEEVNSSLDLNFFRNSFWEIAKRNSDRLEEYVVTEDANKQYEEQMKYCRHVFLNQDKLQTKNFKSTFVLTYINHGKLSSNTTGLFNILDYYCGSCYERRNKKNMAAHVVSAIKNSFSWSITYKTEDLSVEVVDLWAKNIQTIMEKLVSNSQSKL